MAIFNSNHRKEKYFNYQYSLFDISENKLHEVVTIRMYETKTYYYAVVWVNSLYLVASSKSYYKHQAIDQALKNLELPNHNSNLGMWENMIEIAKQVNPESKTFHQHVAHG